MAKSVEYLGHKIDKDGISALPNKVDAIVNAPHPTNVPNQRTRATLIPGLIELLREVYSKSGHYTSSATASQPQVELDCRMRGSLSDGQRPASIS